MKGESRKPNDSLHPSQNGEPSNPSGNVHPSSNVEFHVTTVDSVPFPDSASNSAYTRLRIGSLQSSPLCFHTQPVSSTNHHTSSTERKRQHNTFGAIPPHISSFPSVITISLHSHRQINRQTIREEARQFPPSSHLSPNPPCEIAIDPFSA